MDYYDYSSVDRLVDIEVKMNLTGKNVLVLGIGETGLSMAKWLVRQGARVRVADSRFAPPNLQKIENLLPETEIFTGPFGEKVFDGMEMIAISPGVSAIDPHIRQVAASGMPIVGDITLFKWALEQSNAPAPKILAVTGTNGKTTVTAMVGVMLKKAGWDVEVAGNIGPAVLDAFMQRLDEGRMPQAWVLEVSSFQLETTENLNADVATVLNLSEDHMDRYNTMIDYTQAKARIFMYKNKGEGIQVLNREDPHSMAMALTEKKQITFGLDEPATNADFGIMQSNGEFWLVEGKMLLMKTSDLVVNGLHNVANALAALALCRALQVPVEPLLASLREFRGLPHRMEKVAAFNDVTFVDDSKSTNVGATIAALNGLQQNVVLIAGGEGKGQDFTLLTQAILAWARAVVLIGLDADKIKAALEECHVPVLFAKTMEDAMQKSFLLAQKGDVVLLSPACASFDMFKNYVHRAEVFVAAVKDIETRFFSFGQKKH